jgi:hypothetical protein
MGNICLDIILVMSFMPNQYLYVKVKKKNFFKFKKIKYKTIKKILRKKKFLNGENIRDKFLEFKKKK